VGGYFCLTNLKTLQTVVPSSTVIGKRFWNKRIISSVSILSDFWRCLEIRRVFLPLNLPEMGYPLFNNLICPGQFRALQNTSICRKKFSQMIRPGPLESDPSLPTLALGYAHQKQGRKQETHEPLSFHPSMIKRRRSKCLQRPKRSLHFQKLLVSQSTSSATTIIADRKKYFPSKPLPL